MDSKRLSEVRECKLICPMQFESGKNCGLFEIAPPIIGQEFGLGGIDIDELLIIPRHEGESVLSPDKFPVFCYAARSLRNKFEERVVRSEEVQNIGRCELYSSREDAENSSL